MYAVAAGSAAISCIGWLQAFDAIMESKPTFLNALPIFIGGVWVGGVSVLFLTGLLVSLYFMWDVRQDRPVEIAPICGHRSILLQN